MKAIEEQLARLTAGLRATMQRRLRASGSGPKTWRLPQPRVCVMEPKRSRRIRGWHSAKRWEQGAVSLNEIVLTPASVGKGVFHAAGVVAHELVHLANAVIGREDTSRQGRYHNNCFRTTAEAMGLIVERAGIHGWSQTCLDDALVDRVRDLVRRGVVKTHVFKYRRRPAPVATASLVKICCDCGVFAYVTRSKVDEFVLQCGACGTVLTLPEG